MCVNEYEKEKERDRERQTEREKCMKNDSWNKKGKENSKDFQKFPRFFCRFYEERSHKFYNVITPPNKKRRANVQWYIYMECI